MWGRSQLIKPIIIIPARLAAVRLPRKPLLEIGDKPMILHVLRRAQQAEVGPVVVACCCQETADVVQNAGGKAIITDPRLPKGTDRVHAALQQLDTNEEYDCIINLQGDLPLIDPSQIRQVMGPLVNPAVDIATLAVPVKGPLNLNNPAWVKIAIAQYSSTQGRALYFSRAAIPFGASLYYHHVGIYAYRRASLEKFVALPIAPLEESESLEQLRALEAGLRIDVELTDTMPLSVDTADDLALVRAAVSNMSQC